MPILTSKWKTSISFHQRVHISSAKWSLILNLSIIQWIEFNYLAYRNIYFSVHCDIYWWFIDGKGKFSATHITVINGSLIGHSYLRIHFFRYYFVSSQSRFAVNSDTDISITRPQTVPPDNSTIRPHRNTSVASDIVHFPIVDAFIMRLPSSATVCVQRRVYILQSVSSRALIHINGSCIVIRHCSDYYRRLCSQLAKARAFITESIIKPTTCTAISVERVGDLNATLCRHCDFSLGRSTFH